MGALLMSYDLCVGVPISRLYTVFSVLNVKALVVGAFNQEKALVGAFSVIPNLWMDLRFQL